ncbi:MAG TPA: PAS domain S-box protein [Gammaproteobacteria bacterium]
MPDRIRRRRRKFLAIRIAFLFLSLGIVWLLLRWTLSSHDSALLHINDIGFVVLLALLAYFVIDRLVNDIQHKNYYFRQLTDNIREVFWVGSPDWARVFYISPAYEAVWGLSRSNLYANPRSWLDAVHTEDLAQVLEEIPKSPDLIGNVIEFSPYRIVKPDGEIRWIKARAFPVHDENGNIRNVAGIAEDITRLVTADNALKQKEFLYREILNNAPVLVSIKNLKGDYIFANRQFRVLGGPDPKQFVGKNVYDVFPREIADELRKSDLQVQQSSSPLVREQQFNHKDGSLHTYLTFKFALRNENSEVNSTCAISLDITERMQMELALQKEKERAQAYLDLAGVALLAIEADETVSLINKKGCELLGYSEEEIIGRNWFDNFIPKLERDKVKAAFERLISGQDETIEYFENSLLNKAGEERLIAWHNSVFRDENGKVIRTLSSGADITDQRRAENEAAQLMRQLQQSQKMDAIGHLTGGISHDFNNILTSIMGYTELTILEAKRIENEKILNYLKNVIRSSERARDLVAQLLAFSRGVATELRLLELDKLVNDFLPMLRATLPSSIQLTVKNDCTDCMINADAVQLNQILMNLSINSRDAMESHGEILYRLKHAGDMYAECSSCHQIFSGDFLELDISDNGEGIESSIVNHIFDPFFTTKEVGKGTGMGLSMVHGIMHAHGGHVLVESSPEKGTLFRLFFPRSNQDIKYSQIQDQAEVYRVNDVSVSLHGHALLVDDEHMIASYIAELLQGCGMQVTTIDSSHQALEKYKSNPTQFDLIITDQTMPGLTGVELVTGIRDISKTVPIILMTGYSDEIDPGKLAALQINCILQKPMEQNKLLLVVEKLLQK